MRTLALSLAALNLTLVAQNAIMVIYAQERLGLDARGFGLLLTTYGLGGVVGGLVAGPLSDRFGARTLLRLALTVEMLVPAALALTCAPLLAGAILALFGCHAIVFGAVLASLRQRLTPDALRGRVGGAFRFIEEGTAAPGALLGGALAALAGPTAPFWCGALVGAAVLVYAWPRLVVSRES